MLGIPTLIPDILKIMVTVVAILTLILMGILVIKIYRDEARDEEEPPDAKER